MQAAKELLINPRNHPAIANALLYLASRCDGAKEQDREGFNGPHSEFGHSLANQIQEGRALTKPQQKKALEILQTYKNRQLKEAKITLPTEEELGKFFGPKIDELEATEVSPGVWTVLNKTKKHAYKITSRGGHYSCDCPASSECKHIKHIRGLSTPATLGNVIDLATRQPIAAVTLPEPVLIEAPTLERIEVSEPWEEGLTLGQKAAINDIVPFAMGRTRHKQHALIGSAGVGKTFTLQRLTMAVQSLTDNFRPVFCAPSHKAVNVLRTMGAKADLRGIEYATVAAITHHRIDYDDDGKEILVANAYSSGPHLNEFSFAVVDEGSMVGEAPYKILASARLPILFMGDRCQLPPVNEDESPTMDLPNYSELTEIMRYSGPIGDAAQMARDAVLKVARRRPVFQTDLGEEMKGVRDCTEDEWFAYLIKAYQAPNSKANRDHTRVLAWRNERVSQLNGIIRSSIYGPDAPEYVPGERLMAKKSVIQEVHKTSEWGRETVRDEVIMHTCTECTIQTAEKTQKGDLWYWNLEVVDDLGKWHEVRMVAQESWEEFAKQALEWRKELQETKKNGQKPNWKSYYSWMHNLTAFTPTPNAKPMKSLQYAYALTVHQSQGSTFQNCFVDINDICRNAKPEKTLERNRCIYTAITRAAQRLFILT